MAGRRHYRTSSYICERQVTSGGSVPIRLAMTEGNVRVVRHRALEALRACMSQKVSWEGAS